MKNESIHHASVILTVMLVMTAFQFVSVSASGQESRPLPYRLTLPEEIKRPDLPRSDQKVFNKIPDNSVLLEIILHPDGAVTGFEKRTLTLGGIKTHARKLVGDGQIRSLLGFAANFGKKGSEKEGEKTPALADVDLVVYASPECPLYHLNRVMQIACEYGICINRFHFRVKDEKTGKEGVISYHLPCFYVNRDDPKEKEFLSTIHIVTLFNGPEGPSYAVEFPPASGKEEKMFFTLKKLEREIEAVREKFPKTLITFCLGGVPAEMTEKPLKTTCKDLIDVLTFLAVKGADLKCTKTVVAELVELDD